MLKNIQLRPTRLRKNANIRRMLQETSLSCSDLIFPLFINANIKSKQEIASMPGQYQLSVNDLAAEIKQIASLNIPAVILFGIPKYKDEIGSSVLKDDGIIQTAIKIIKDTCPDIIVITDVCLCEYTSHGHCGILDGTKIDTSATLENLAQQAVSFAKAGADWVAPSSMTDGMVAAIRNQLDLNNFTDVAILSYAVKYASALYSPFRMAADGAPQFGDRSTYQMQPSNRNEAILEASLDIQQGADLIMVKPALFYLDIVRELKNRFPEVPICSYQVSGEYAMFKQAAKAGALDLDAAIIESLTAIKRAGANIIISYFAKELAAKLQ